QGVADDHKSTRKISPVKAAVASAPEGSWGGGVRVWQITSGDRRPPAGRPPPERLMLTTLVMIHSNSLRRLDYRVLAIAAIRARVNNRVYGSAGGAVSAWSSGPG